MLGSRLGSMMLYLQWVLQPRIQVERKRAERLRAEKISSGVNSEGRRLGPGEAGWARFELSNVVHQSFGH